MPLPESLSRCGFSLDTHIFRYRNDALIRNADGSVRCGYGVDELLRNTIWHSCVGALNDPFEVYFHQNKNEAYELSDEDLFFHWAHGDREARYHELTLNLFFHDHKEDIKKSLTENIDSSLYILQNSFRTNSVVASFTTYCNSRLMWGYYCSGFKGFCLIYNLEKLKKYLKNFGEVIYSEHRPKLDVISYFIKRKKQESIVGISHFALFKHSEWAHENEYRSFFMTDKEYEINMGGALIKLGQSCVDGVIIGGGCNKETHEAIIQFSRENGIKMFKAEADLNSFTVSIAPYSPVS